MGDKVNKKTRAELYEMLAEAVRNTQPQPVHTQPEPVHTQPEPKRNTQLAPKRETRSHKTRRAPKRTAKIKRVRG
jgi:hypothetical protein